MDNDHSDELLIIEDSITVTMETWDILIVDDDLDVHAATEHALQGVEMLGRVPRFLHAHSAAEAGEVLARHPDVAVILLDVVMETPSAGLDLVEHIRHTLGLAMPRIILRTGQPGYAPEMTAIREYDINDYKTKSELTRSKLFTAVLAAVRSYDQLRRMNASRKGLEQIVKASGDLLSGDGLQEFSAGVIRQLAALIGVDPEGLVCAQASVIPGSSDDTYVVFAAAGRFEPYIHQQLSEIGDTRIAGELGRCLKLGQHVFGQGYLVLHFPMREHGSFAVYVESSHLPDDMDRHLIEVFCNNAAICAANISLLGRLKDFAYFDRLVGLPNRTAFLQALDRIFEDNSSRQYRAALIDIDQFAELNNAFGHAHGDSVLLALTSRLKEHFGSTCFIARIAGDAFGLLGRKEHLQVSELRTVLDKPYSIAGAAQVVAISCGFVDLEISGPNGQAVLKDASMARKLARENGVNSDAVYSQSVGFQAKERTRLLQQLQGAFDHDRLFPVYQPQVDLATGKLLGFEALMRWRGDDGKYVAPDQFIPLAEQSGLIIGMGAWILRSALFSLLQLQTEGWKGLRMAINVSAVQFRMPDFVDSVKMALEDTGIAPQLVELEITESVAMMGQSLVESTLHKLRQLGIAIAIDDFGTGFSSLSYLDRLPLDRIKIDRSFVIAMQHHGPGEGQRIVDLVVRIGRSMNLRVIAEGIENEAQAKHLLEIGCHEGQGFLYGRPMNIDDLRAWLQQRP